MLLDISHMVVGLLILILGGNFLIKGAENMARRFRISPLVAGVTVVAFGTSAPELLISIQASLIGSSDFTMGNIIGSNICNLALIFGVTLLIYPVSINIDSIKIDWPVAMSASLILYFIILYGPIGYIEGIIFLILLTIYTIFIVLKSRKEWQNISLNDDNFPRKSVNSNTIWIDLFFLILGSTGLYYGSEWLILGAKQVAIQFGISERVLGIMVLALGTSLPELVTSLVAAFKRQTDLAIGNLMGSNIFNILFILGIAGLINEINVSPAILNIDMIWMIGITLIILPLMAFKRKMGRSSGLLLLVIYFFYAYIVIG